MDSIGKMGSRQIHEAMLPLLRNLAEAISNVAAMPAWEDEWMDTVRDMVDAIGDLEFRTLARIYLSGFHAYLTAQLGEHPRTREVLNAYRLIVNRVEAGEDEA